MRRTLTVSLPEAVRKELDRTARAEGVSRSDLVRESVRDYLFVRHFRALRKRMVPTAAAQGIHTDEDVFRNVS